MIGRIRYASVWATLTCRAFQFYFESAMRWSVEDGIRFGIDLSALIADNRDADDLIDMLTGRIEDTSLEYSPCFAPELFTHAASARPAWR